jgi:hypothetical protein
MSILKEPKSIDDQSIKRDTPFEKWEDKYPTDEYRTFATHVPMCCNSFRRISDRLLINRSMVNH